MGTMNLLNSSINGKLGTIYGVKQHRKHYAKAIPFSHTPHTQRQQDNVRAFEKLNRFSSGVAKVFFPFMGLSDKTLLHHNQVARLFKPCIKNKVFNLQDLKEVITESNETVIKTFEINLETNEIHVIAQCYNVINKEIKSAWFVGVVDTSGKVLFATTPDTNLFETTFSSQLLETEKYSCITFCSVPINSHIKLSGLSIYQ